MSEGAEEAHNKTEAVKEWRWTANDVVGSEMHARAYKVAVVDDITRWR